MKCSTYIAVVLVIFAWNAHGLKWIIKSLEQCEPNGEYPIMFHITPYFENDLQYIDGNATLNRPVGDDLKTNFRAEILLGETYRTIMNVVERKSCSSIHKYLGEFAYDVERRVGLNPGMCPMPNGKYRLKHYLLQTSKIAFQGFPIGDLRFTAKLIDKNNEVVACAHAIVNSV